MTLLTEALILGLFAMSLDLMFGYTRLRLVRPCRRLRARRLRLRLDTAEYRHAPAVRRIRGRHC